MKLQGVYLTKYNSIQLITLKLYTMTISKDNKTTNSAQRRAYKRLVRYAKKRRERDHLSRCPEGDGKGKENCKVAPAYFTGLPENKFDLCPDIVPYYQQFPTGIHTLVEVRQGSDCICKDPSGKASRYGLFSL